MAPELQQQSYNQLAYYTLGHQDPSFIHQHIVDAQMAQWADEQTKPIAISFALIGLYLYLEKGYSGREVQLAHMALAKRRKAWPKWPLPEERGEIQASDVVLVPAGAERDQKIKEWCASVWEAYAPCQEGVAGLLQAEGY